MLDGVLRPIDIAEDAICDPVAAVAIKVDELGERIFVAVTRTLDQRCPHSGPSLGERHGGRFTQ